MTKHGANTANSVPAKNKYPSHVSCLNSSIGLKAPYWLSNVSSDTCGKDL